jgi:uncharacterized protein YkwD
MGDEIFSNLPWLIGAAVLIYLSWVIIKKVIAVVITLAVAAAVFVLLMYNDETGDPRIPEVAHQIVSEAKQIVEQITEQLVTKAAAGKAEAGKAEAGKAEAGKAEAGKAEAGKAEAGTNTNAPISDSASLLSTHNEWRAKVGVPPLVWSDTLALDAQGWADELKKDSCAMAHSPQTSHGENLFWASATRRYPAHSPKTVDNLISTEIQDISAAFVVNDWASEISDYNYDTNSCAPGEMCGHYTQIVWRGAEEVGCAKSICDDKSQLWVCRYNPPGNYKGEWPY